jgi:hypothetical protein
MISMKNDSGFFRNFQKMISPLEAEMGFFISNKIFS